MIALRLPFFLLFLPCFGFFLLAGRLQAETTRHPPAESLLVTPAQRDARLAAWRESRFGMFVHWGVSSGLQGYWRGRVHHGYAEHIQRAQKIPMADYRREVVSPFNPTDFDADAWIRAARDAGMGYFVITAKHHDGFAMFDSRASAYDIVEATAFARDPMPALRDACRKYGVKFGFYYSHAFDWGEENAPGNDWDYDNPGGDKLLHGPNWWLNDTSFLPKARRYVDEKAIPQLRELIAQYQPDLLWFDTPHKLPPEENLRILAAVREAAPHIPINSRVLSGQFRHLYTGLYDYLSTTDKPAEFPPQTEDWEGIPTTNESYGYSAHDLSHKPPAHFIRLLAKASARGGNILMNIGPRADGSIDPVDLAILEGIGRWWRVNGESIRGTTRTPLPVQAWGESTRKGDRLYLHVFNWPADGRLAIGGLQTPIAKAWLLADPSRPLPVDGHTLTLPDAAPDAAVSVIAVDCAAAPQTEDRRLLVANQPIDTLRAFDAKLAGLLRFGPGKIDNAWVANWKKLDDAVCWPVRLSCPATYRVILHYEAPLADMTRKVEGDAGKEQALARQGAGGVYRVTLGNHAFQQTVRPGARVDEVLGEVALAPGDFEIRVVATAITGEELFRLRGLTLQPIYAR
ncbi:MAG: hypothetical protein RLZZ50_1925 [Verrucomicrobiota bacterium]